MECQFLKIGAATNQMSPASEVGADDNPATFGVRKLDPYNLS